MRWGIGVIAVLAAAALVGCDGTESPAGWTLVQLTDNDLRDYDAVIDGSTVAWVGEEGFGRRREIFVYDGESIRQLTDDRFSDESPRVSGTTVVWRGHRPADEADLLGVPQVMLYDGNTVRQLTTGAGVYQIDIDGPHAAWAAPTEGEGTGIFLFDGDAIKEIAGNAHGGLHPVVSGGKVAWTGWNGEGWQIFLYNGQDVRAIAFPDYMGRAPQIGDSAVAWIAGPSARPDSRQGFRYGRFDEVYLYDGLAVRRLTDNDEEESDLAVSGASIVWQGFDGYDMEVYLYDGATVEQLTDNMYDDLRPVVSGTNVAWVADLPSSREIFVYDGRASTQLTNDDYEDRLGGISGLTVVYEHWDGNDWEVFLAVPEDRMKAP